jgi:hypothetical protein
MEQKVHMLSEKDLNITPSVPLVMGRLNKIKEAL